MVKRKRTTSKVKSHDHPQHAHIPHEVILQILQKLPVKTLMKFTCVCKLWLESIVNDPRFEEAHFLEPKKNPILKIEFSSSTLKTHRFFYLQKDEFGIGKKDVLPRLPKPATVLKQTYRKKIGDCNGLVCFRVGNPFYDRTNHWYDFDIEIFNFSKLEKLRIVSRIQIPREVTYIGYAYEFGFAFGFGYECVSNKYKLTCILDYNAKSCYKFFILTLEANNTQLWRKIKIPAILQEYRLCAGQPSQCINGVLYWWFYERKKYSRKVLLSFDLQEEKFQLIDLPKNNLNTAYHYLSVYHPLEYRKSLCLSSVKKYVPGSGVVKLYILKDRIKQLWVKETFKFNLPVTVRIRLTSIRFVEFAGRRYLYRLFDKGRIGQVIRRRSHIIRFYDLESRESKKVRFGGKCGSNYHVTNYVENLISLRAWETKDADGGGEIGRFHDTSVVRKQVFKEMPPNNGAAVSYFSREHY